MIKYKEAIDLGFKRVDGRDTVFENTYGYEYFFLEKYLLKAKKGVHILANWNPESMDIDLMKCDKDGNILSQLNFTDIEDYMIYHNFITGKK